MRRSSLALAFAALPSRAFACAVCFGQADNQSLVKGFTIGGAMLLTFTFSLLGALVYAVVRLEKTRLAADRRLGLLDP